jgi:hypothetical protein
LAGCRDSTNNLAITTLDHKQEILLKKDSGQGNIHGIFVRGSGKLGGEARISLLLNGKPYKFETLSGPIDFKWGGDWYSDEAKILYEPIHATSGQLILQYSFKEIR